MTKTSADEHTEQAMTEDYNRFVEGLQILAVQTESIEGRRLLGDAAPQTNYQLEAAFAVQDDQLTYKFDVTATLLSPSGEEAGKILASFILVLRTSADAPATPAVVELFGASNAPQIVYPYLRETLQSTANRLGFLGVVLPLAAFGSSTSASATVITSPGKDQSSDPAPS